MFQKTFLYIGILVVLSLGCTHQFHETSQRKVVFLLFDAGETKALLPVIENLRARGVPEEIIALGPAQSLVEKDPSYVNLQKKCKSSDNLNLRWPRDLQLPAFERDRLLQCLTPTLVVTGLFSSFQEQISAGFKSRNISVWGYYDSFSESGLYAIGTDLLSSLEKILVPSNSIQKAAEKRVPGKSISVVGQPSLEEWRSFASKTDARKILARLELTKTFPVILYAGGYGEDYEASFREFVKSSLELKDFIILVSPHPSSKGSFEKNTIEEFEAHHLRVVPGSIATQEVAIIADVVVTHRSSVGVQALFLSKPVIYFDLRPSNYSDLAIENHWATQVKSIEEFLPLVRSKQKERNYNPDKDIYGALGIPKDSALLISKMIEAKVLD
jgi:CDP-glycerol glycerophosphotransferase (TagB/SpsB family)